MTDIELRPRDLVCQPQGADRTENEMCKPTIDTAANSNTAKAATGVASGKNRGPGQIKPQKFYLISHRSHSTQAGREFLNKKAFPGWGLQPPSRFDRGFRDYPVRPRFYISRRLGRKLQDFEKFGEYWMLSERARSVLLSISETDFQFFAVDTEVDPGHEPVALWLCDVIPVLDAVDKSRSNVDTVLNDLGEITHLVSGRSSLFFDENIVDSHSAFRPRTAYGFIVCNEFFKKTIRENALTGLSFRDAIKR
jgi:hypothetical protein